MENPSSYVNLKKVNMQLPLKANRLVKSTVSSISAGRYPWTTFMSMSLSTVFGGKLD